MNGGPSALELWREKLASFLAEEAITADPEKKFQLRVQIREAKQKIAELELQLTEETRERRQEVIESEPEEKFGCLPDDLQSEDSRPGPSESSHKYLAPPATEGSKPLDVIEGTLTVDTISWRASVLLTPPFQNAPEVSIIHPSERAADDPKIELVTPDKFDVKITNSNQAGEWKWRARGRLLDTKSVDTGSLTVTQITEGKLTLDTISWRASVLLTPPFQDAPEISIIHPSGRAADDPKIELVTPDRFDVKLTNSNQAGEWKWRARGRQRYQGAANAPAERDQPQVDFQWRWFILGCLLLLAALILVFWGFSLGKLTWDQQRLLVWALPLASGFSAAAFAGSIYTQARDWIPGLAITATGGFAVWLITFFFLFPENKVTGQSETTTPSPHTSNLASASSTSIPITTPAPSSPSPSLSPTALPTPSTSPPLSKDQIQQLWKGVIYRALHSKLIYSYVPDQVHTANLIDAIRDNEDLADRINDFERQVNDPILKSSFISIDKTLDEIQEDLQSVDRRVIDYPDIAQLLPTHQRQLQTAEYGRVNLLGLLTQVSLQLELPPPAFPESSPKIVPTATPTPTKTPTPNPTPVAARLLIFGNHFQKDRVYIVNKAPSSNIRDNDAYIQECCSGPDQILWLNWDNDARPDALLGRSAKTAFLAGKYTVTHVQEIIRDENIRVQPGTQGLPAVPAYLPHVFDNEVWWIFDVKYIP